MLQINHHLLLSSFSFHINYLKLPLLVIIVIQEASSLDIWLTIHASHDEVEAIISELMLLLLQCLASLLS